MDEKWEFVPISGKDFYQGQPNHDKKESDSLFDPDGFTFQDPNPKTPDLFRTTEFDKHKQPFDESLHQNHNFPSIPQGSGENIREHIQHEQYYHQPNEHTNASQVHRTSSAPKMMERQLNYVHNPNYDDHYGTSPSRTPPSQYYNPNFSSYIPQSPPMYSQTHIHHPESINPNQRHSPHLPRHPPRSSSNPRTPEREPF